MHSDGSQFEYPKLSEEREDVSWWLELKEMTAAYADPFLEGIYTALHYDLSNAILIPFIFQSLNISSKEKIETTY